MRKHAINICLYSSTPRWIQYPNFSDFLDWIVPRVLEVEDYLFETYDDLPGDRSRNLLGSPESILDALFRLGAYHTLLHKEEFSRNHINLYDPARIPGTQDQGIALEIKLGREGEVPSALRD